MFRRIEFSEKGGGADSFKLVSTPKPHVPKEYVLVKVKAASINPVDFKVKEYMSFWDVEEGNYCPFNNYIVIIFS